MSCKGVNPETGPDKITRPDVPFVYSPYIDKDIYKDIGIATWISEMENEATDKAKGLYPIPPPLTSATYPRRLEILRNLWDELDAVNEHLRTVLDAEEQKWNEWNETQKRMIDWQTSLTNNTRFVWCKKKWARFHYNVFSRRKTTSKRLHYQSCEMKSSEARGKRWQLVREAARQLGELDELDKAEKLKRDGRGWFERVLWMPNFMMEEIAFARLAKQERKKLRAAYPGSCSWYCPTLEELQANKKE